jgi:nardilysin
MQSTERTLESTKPLSDRKNYRIVDVGAVRVLCIHDPSTTGALAGDSTDDSDEEGSFETSSSDESHSDATGDSDASESSTSDARCSGSSYVAWCVPAGSFDDPADLQGLAHFCEHLVFMGSSAFPKENELDSFLALHGGNTNAFTEYEYTVFQIEVESQGLGGALERLAACFASPLFAPSAVERELEVGITFGARHRCL